MQDSAALLRLVERYFEHDTEIAIHYLESLTREEAAEVLKRLPPPLAVKAVRHMQVGYSAQLLKDADEDILKALVSGLDSQLAASILMRLPDEARERLIGYISGKLKNELRELLTYPEGSVGRLMTTDFISLRQELSAAEAIEKIRFLAQKRYPASYVYVVDDDNRLIGVLNMRDLMLAPSEQPLEQFMRREVHSVHCFTDREEAAAELARRRYFAAPVVDGENHILGIIKAERMIHGVQEDAARNIQKMFGVGGDERAFSSIGYSLKKRLGWLHVNLATAFLAAAVVALFEDVIAKITVLAVFLPVVAGQGGNAGAQSLAVVMRGLVMREIPKEKVFTLIVKEGKLGAMNGAIIGIVTALVAWLWHGNPYLGVVIGLGMLLNLVFAGLSGASIPILMKRLGLDPAQSSSIILTTVTDVLGFFAFLGFAVLFQNQLM